MLLRSLLLLLLLVSAAFGSKTALASPDNVRAVNGVLDLRDWDFDRDGPIRLAGEWQFWPGALISAADFATERAPEPSLAPVPGRWPSLVVDGKQLAREGVGTYRLRILLAKDAPPLALRHFIRYTAWDIRINGRYVAGSGVVGIDAGQTSTAGQNPIGAVPSADVLDVQVRTAAFGGFGGLTAAPLLSDANDLFADWQRDFVLLGSFLAVCVVIGLLYLMLFWLHRDQREYLAFAIMSAGIVLFQLTANTPLGLTLFGWAPGQLIGQLNSWIYPIIWVPALIGGWLLYPNRLSFRLLLPALILVLLIPIASQFNPYVPNLLRYTLLVALAATVATLGVIAIRAAVAGQPWAVALGFAWLMLAGSNIALAFTLASVEWMAAGYTLLLIVLAVMLFDRISRNERAVISLNSQLAQANTDLEGQVADRTRHLSRTLEDLQTAKDQLVERERLASLGQLVAGVAHEMNTPIGVALTTSTHLHSCLDDLEQDFAAGRISRTALSDFITNARESAYILTVNINRTAALVESFKQVAADQTEDSRRQFDLGEYLADVAIGFHLPRERVRVELDVPPGVLMDSFPGALAQALGELAANAGDHGFTGGRSGMLRVEARLLSPTTVAVCVEDDGAGIPPDIKAKVFEPFITGARADGYTGLGLHMVHNLVTGPLGGRIDAEDRPGGGSRFVMVLPTKAPVATES